MAVHFLTLSLPGSLYERLIRRAERTHRPVEVELLEAVATGMSVDEDLPAELAQAVSAYISWMMSRFGAPLKALCRQRSPPR